ncbi:sensor histidine kinase [Clostridium algidicarnis]|uniref:sensor histidine kinase n=1 Tax=Clostridium algidicarnis TaxID=37659 RepID=UPI001FAB51AB|nr:HAMP domain-containing sensor histidine kinase [Clostridium algidicarnis]
MSKEKKKMKYKLTKKLIKRLYVSLVTFSFSLFLLLIIFLELHGLTDPTDNFLYNTSMFIWNNKFVVFVLTWGLGVLIIFIFCWIETLKYLDEIILATKDIYTVDEKIIELPEELNDVEKDMNLIKTNLKRSQENAKEAEQRKNDLVVYLAHDLKTPLTSIIGYLTLLRDEIQISEEQRERYLSISLGKAKRLEDLINEFFEITRFNFTTLTLDLNSVNLTRMIEQNVYEFKPIFLEKGLNCTISVAPDIMIKCDVDKLQRVLDNLLRNAVNYSFSGTTIEISVIQNNDGVKLKVLNHGNTIAKEKLSRIFEQFYRLDAARITQNGGAGLGLAISKEIVELHGGTISAFSENETIIFEVAIPAL